MNAPLLVTAPKPKATVSEKLYKILLTFKEDNSIMFDSIHAFGLEDLAKIVWNTWRTRDYKVVQVIDLS